MRQWIHFHIFFLFFFKEASIRTNNNHIIFLPLKAYLLYSVNKLGI